MFYFILLYFIFTGLIVGGGGSLGGWIKWMGPPAHPFGGWIKRMGLLAHSF
jgi:hypothetical protein